MSVRIRARGFAWLIVGACASAPAFAQDNAAARPDAKQACIAAVEQGQTLRDDGKYRQARASFVTCSRDVCPRVIQQSCTKWLRELDESAPTIVLAAKDEEGHDLTDVKVSFDGTPFATTLDGNPVEIDAGEHTITFEREGSAPVETRLLLRAGERARVVSATMRPLGSELAAHPPPPGALGREPTLSARHVVATVATVGALAALGTGITFVLKSNDDANTAAGLRARLPGSSACYPPAGSVGATCQALGSAVHSQFEEANVATGLFVGAGVFAVGAAAAWLFWRPSTPSADVTQVTTTGAIVPLPGGGALQLSGRF
jgi:hypothetical protein